MNQSFLIEKCFLFRCLTSHFYVLEEKLAVVERIFDYDPDLQRPAWVMVICMGK